MRLYGVTGWKNAGKTTLMVRLIAEFTRRGMVVSSVKHAHHATDIDHEGTDSYRHREAGASEVMLVSDGRWALMHELRGADEPPLDDLLARLSPADLVLIEGYKTAPHPKIECWRGDTTRPLIAAANPSIRAIAAKGGRPESALPLLDLDDTGAIADFIMREVG